MFRVILFLIAFTACSGSPEPTTAPEPVEQASGDATPGDVAHAGHAPSGVVPGSHADWCGEHAVPESQCSRCDSTLVAAFKATDDWCPEHGLPESQCLVCNPELKIERPPKDN